MSAQHPIEHHQYTPDWSVLRTLCLFRTLLGVLLIYVQPAGTVLFSVDGLRDSPFAVITSTYVVFGMVLIALLLVRRIGFDIQVTLHVACDIAFIGLLAMLVDGLTQTVAILLCVPLAAAVLLRRGGLLYSLATIVSAVLVIAELINSPGQRNLYATLALILAFFAVAQLSVLHIRRLRDADKALQATHLELSSLTDLAEEVLSASTQGLIVLDEQSQVQFVNATAMVLLDASEHPLPVHLSVFAPSVYIAYSNQSDCVKDREGFAILRIHVSALRGGKTLISLLDLREIDAMTEQVRLASLGRWSAGVAHEIRNPLCAISQSLQLLEGVENPSNAPKLLDIIARNTARIDAVVNDVLSLSRTPNMLDTVSLSEWINAFHAEWQLAHPDADICVEDEIGDGGCILSDEKRLYHIVSNLCGNALAHGDGHTVRIELGTTQRQSRRAYRMTVSNPGAELTDAQRQRMFEPFFTTSSSGSGLGLFVVRELCKQLGYTLRYRYESGHHCLSLELPAATPQSRAA